MMLTSGSYDGLDAESTGILISFMYAYYLYIM